MKENDVKLESGQEYTLEQLFNGKNKIVIPDLQRDYCWGDKAWNKDANNYTELVSGFIDNLISSVGLYPLSQMLNLEHSNNYKFDCFQKPCNSIKKNLKIK